MTHTRMNGLRAELSRLETFLAEVQRQPGVDRYRLVDLRRRSASLREALWSAELATGGALLARADGYQARRRG